MLLHQKPFKIYIQMVSLVRQKKVMKLRLWLAVQQSNKLKLSYQKLHVEFKKKVVICHSFIKPWLFRLPQPGPQATLQELSQCWTDTVELELATNGLHSLWHSQLCYVTPITSKEQAQTKFCMCPSFHSCHKLPVSKELWINLTAVKQNCTSGSRLKRTYLVTQHPWKERPMSAPEGCLPFTCWLWTWLLVNLPGKVPLEGLVKGCRWFTADYDSKSVVLPLNAVRKTETMLFLLENDSSKLSSLVNEMFCPQSSALIISQMLQLACKLTTIIAFKEAICSLDAWRVIPIIPSIYSCLKMTTIS